MPVNARKWWLLGNHRGKILALIQQRLQFYINKSCSMLSSRFSGPYPISKCFPELLCQSTQKSSVKTLLSHVTKTEFLMELYHSFLCKTLQNLEPGLEVVVRKCSIKRRSKNFRNTHGKTPIPESPFYKIHRETPVLESFF